jgi:hypothetical protein
MKKVLLVLAIISGSIASISITSNANASECTQSNGCGGWSMVDGNGVVVGNVVCQASVCGQDGEWHGKVPDGFGCDGCTYALQVPPARDGSYNGSIVNPISQTEPMHYDAQTQTFSQQGNSDVSSVETFVSTNRTDNSIISRNLNNVTENIITHNSTITDNVSVTANSNVATFSVNELGSDNRPVIKIPVASVQISVDQKVITKIDNVSIEKSITKVSDSSTVVLPVKTIAPTKTTVAVKKDSILFSSKVSAAEAKTMLDNSKSSLLSSYANHILGKMRSMRFWE